MPAKWALLRDYLSAASERRGLIVEKFGVDSQNGEAEHHGVAAAPIPHPLFQDMAKPES